MKTIKKLLIGIITVCVAMCLMCFIVSAEEINGTCGENLTWVFNDDTGLLTISGTGEMTYYNSSSSVPWCSYTESITAVSLPEELTEIGGYAFYGCDKLTNIRLPNNVTSIGNYAFYNCSSLTDITISDVLYDIGFYAFYNCTSLTRISIPDSVGYIGGYAFYNCSKLKDVYAGSIESWVAIDFQYGQFDSNPLSNSSNLYFNDVLATDIVIPDSVTDIHSYAFYNCKSLTSVTIPDSVTYLGNDAFKNCANLVNVAIGDGVSSLYYSTFEGCGKLTNVTIGNSVTFIDWHTFADCTSLKTIKIPNSITHIYSYAFYNCKSLTSVTIGSGVRTIDGHAFENCSSLTNITIPSNVDSIGDSAFCSCTNLSSVTLINGLTTIGNYAFSGCTSLANITIPNSVTTLGQAAFHNCRELTSITLTENITSIGYQMFEGCTSLASITIPDSITSIDSRAFYGCTDLANVTLCNGVTSIGEYTFKNCISLTSITIPNSVTSIGTNAFSSCEGLTSILIPNRVKTIGDYAFEKCINLKTAIIGDGVTKIGVCSFEGCENLTNLTIGNSVEEICSMAFAYCTSLTTITIPDSVHSILRSGFFECTGLVDVYVESVESWLDISFSTSASNPMTYADNLYFNNYLATDIIIPDGTTSIGNYTFYGHSNLLNVTIPSSVTTIGDSAFSGCTGLTSITIPEGITTIGNSAFNHCTGLTSITIPEGVTTIGLWAFQDCKNITNITIPASVTTIGQRAFYGCYGISDVYYKGTEKQWNEISIELSNEHLTQKNIHYNYVSTTDNSSLKITQNPIIIALEDSTEYLVTAVYYDKNGNNILDADIKWTISDSSVIEVLEIQNGFNSNVTFKAKNIGSTKLTAHYNDKTAECCIFVKEIEPQLSVEVNNLVQNENTFTFDVVYGNWFGIDSSSLTEQQREKATVTGCSVDIVLPEGFSFAEDSDERELTSLMLNGSSLAPGESNKVSYTIYKRAADAKNKMVVTAKASNSSDSKKVVKLFVDGRDLTEEDRKAIKDDVRVTIDIAKSYKKIQQRGGKIEYGQYTASKDFTGNEIPIEVTISNFIPSKYFEYEEYLKNNSEFDYNIFSLDVSNVKGFKSVTIDKSSMQNTLKAGESITLYGKAVLTNNYLPMPEDEQSRELSASVEAITLSGDKRVNNFNLTVKNISYKPKVANVTAAANELMKVPNTVCNLNNLAADFDIDLKQCEHISKLITVQLALFSLPEDSLREKIDKKALEKLFGYEEISGAKRGTFIVTIPLTVNGEKIEVDLINTVTVSEYNGTVNAKFDSIKYNAYKLTKNWLGKEEREPEPYKKNRPAGVAAYANMDKLISSVEDYVLDAVSSVTDTALGDTDDAAEFLFGKCANDVLVEAGYESFFDYGWSVYSKAWKTVTVECPVDVYVYNSNDELCGTIINNVPTEMSDEVELEVVNDDKIVKLWGNGYYIKTVATAEGTMSISVSENDYNNGPRRIVSYTNLPLIVGTEYRQNYGEDLNVDSSVYDVLYEDDSIQFADDEIMLLTDNFCLHENTYFTGGNSATCTTAGKTQDEYCSDCSRIIAEGTVIDKLEHSYSSVVTASTCTNVGYTIYTCSICKDTYKANETAKLGHSMGSFIVIEQPSCTENGIEIAYCSRCDYSEMNDLSATGHNYQDGVCTYCGDSKSNNCSCNCHKTGFMGIIWKILKFFYKLFKINPVCQCGAAHY